MAARTGVSAPHRDYDFFFGAFLFALFYGGLEIPDAFAQAFAQVGKLARSEKQQRDPQESAESQAIEQFLTHNFLRGVARARLGAAVTRLRTPN